ncbi:transcriptional regulator [Kineococcus sp. TBRC 1896]|uniref:Transcriptional regulator n=1 Tax=Kineococcus mangrovi TaxID=1660183 RepID=A0ABV4I0Q9_9ACTN
MSTPEPQLQEAVQHPTKLAVAAFLSGCAEAEFQAVRDRLHLTDSTLSRTVSALEDAGFVDVRRGHVGKRSRVWIALSREGRRRLAAHLAALQQIAQQAADLGAEDRGPVLGSAPGN